MKRTITDYERAVCAHLTESAKRRVRVYAAGGFVPNAYKWPCAIQYIEAYRADTGDWVVYESACDAKRSHGRGPRFVVDGRAHQLTDTPT